MISEAVLYGLASITLAGWVAAAIYGWWGVFRDATPRGRIGLAIVALALAWLLVR